MADNDPPSEEEVDVFMELYEKHGTKKAVAEAVQWSRPTVSKWIDRRLEEQEEGEEDPEPEPEADPEQEPEPTRETETREEKRPLPDDLIKEPESPNDILLGIIDRDPKLGDDEAAYLERFFEDYGQLSPSDVTAILQDLSINNKRMTISRITRHYEKAINRRLREDPDLQYDQRWATLLTKETGDNHYIQQAQQVDTGGGGLGGIQPPRGGGRGGRGGNGMESGINAPGPSANGQDSREGIVAPPPQQPQQQMNSQQPQQPPQQAQQAQQGLDPFQQKLLEMLEQKMDDGDSTPTAPQSSSATDQIQELLELQQQMEQLQPGDGGQSAEMADKLGAVVEQMDQRMARLEQQIQEEGGTSSQQQAQQQLEASGDSMLGEIAMLADKVDDPDLLSMLIETQTDPAVLEARAKSKEVENETEWKKAVAESLSPKATETAVGVFSNLLSNLNQQQPPRQPPQQAQQQPQQQARQPQPAQPAQQNGAGNVAVVDEQGQQDEAPSSRPDSTGDTSSPLREEGEREMDGTPDDVGGEEPASEAVDLAEEAGDGEAESTGEIISGEDEA